MGEGLIVRRGILEPPAIMLYDSGNEFIEMTGGWVAGFSQGQGSQIKQVSNFILTTDGNIASRRTYETNNKVDLTNIEKINVDWEGRFIAGNISSCRVKIVDSKNTNVSVVITSFTINNTAFSRRTNNIDVSAITGSYYISVQVWHDAIETNSYELKVHKI